ncbi:MAG: Ig family protein [Bryobacterales bacterium]|nr:Ig family protein [Bryobacterales bacterium]
MSDVHSDFTFIDYPGLQLGYGSTILTGLNNSGAIVGNYMDYTDNSGGGFLYQGGTFTPLSFTTYAINNNGQILGGDNFGLFVYTAGQRASLGALPFTPYGFNDAGMIVGSAGNSGYVYSGGTVTTLLVPGSLQTQAYGLNDNGDIVGSYIDANGRQHGFMATTPEPNYLLIVTGGLGALAFCPKRSRANIV